MIIQSNTETPRTQIESNVNGRAETMLNKSTDFMKKPYQSNSPTQQRALNKSNTMGDSAGFDKQKQKKITPFEFSRDDIYAETLKLGKNDRTILQQKNFKYLLVNPHIYLGGKSILNSDIKSAELRSAQHVDRKKLESQLLRPTSFDGKRDLFPDVLSVGFEQNDSRDKIHRDNMHTSQVLRPKQHISDTLQLKPSYRNYKRGSEFKLGYPLQDTKQAYGTDTEYIGDTTSVQDDDFYKSVSNYQTTDEQVFLDHGRNKSEVVFALSSNMAGLKIPQRANLDHSMQIVKNDNRKDGQNEENQKGGGKPTPLMEVKARVDTNNRGGRNAIGNSLVPHALTFVLKKGRAKPSLNYICDNLFTYAEPLFNNISKQQQAAQKGMVQNDSKGKVGKAKLNSRLLSPHHTSVHIQGSTAATSAILPSSIKQHTNGTPPSAATKKHKRVPTSPSSEHDTSKFAADSKKGTKKKTKKKRGVEKYKDKVQVGHRRENDDGETIMEMSEEEYEDDGSPREKEPVEQTWQEIFYENEALKQQIASQITIFEQYLRVALLQQRQKEIEIRRGNIAYEKGLFDSTEVVLDRHGSNQFDEETVMVNDAKEERLRVQQRSLEAESKFYANQKMGQQRMKIQEEDDVFDDVKVLKRNKSSARGSARQRSQSATSQKSHGGKDTQHKRGLKQSGSQRGISKDNDNKQNSGSKGGKPGLASRFLGFVQKLAGGLIMPKLGIYGYNLQPDAHVAHQIWLDRIQNLWKKLERYNNNQCINVQIQIDHNKKRLNELTRENVFELEVQTADQRLLLRAKFNAKKMQQAISQTKEERQLRKVQKKLRRALKQSEEIGTWGLNNYVVSLQIKCRMTEDIVDLAQKLHLKPNKTLEEKMERMKRLRDQIYSDLYYFIAEREKVHWRNWDHAFMGNYKPDIPPRRNMLAYYKERVDVNLLQIEFLELKSLELQDDINGFNRMNSENIVTVTDRFGHDHWLHFWQIRQLRRKQMKQVYAFDPSQQFLQSLSNPIDHIKFMQQQTQQQFSEKYPTPVPEVEETASERARRVVKFSDEVQVQTPTAQEVANNVHVMSIDVDDREDENGDYTSQGDDLSKGPSGIGTGQVQSVAMSEGEESKEEKESHQSQASTQKEKFVPKWLIQIEKSKKEKEAKERAEKEARIARLQKLMDDTEDDDGLAEILDKHAVERKMNDYLGKINTHLEVELQLLDAWRHPDEIKEDENENLEKNDSAHVRDMKKQ